MRDDERPLQDEEYGDDAIARAEKALYFESDRDGVRRHAAAIRNRKLFPLKHLGWCDFDENDDLEVRVPELIKGRILPKRPYS